MTDRPDIDTILAAVSSLHMGATTLTEHARMLATTSDATLQRVEEPAEIIADALAIALDAMEDLNERETQLRGALARFLEGWA